MELHIVLLVLGLVVGYWGGFHQGRKVAISDRHRYVTNYHRYAMDNIYKRIMLAIGVKNYEAQEILNDLRGHLDHYSHYEGYKDDTLVGNAETTDSFIFRETDNLKARVDREREDDKPII